jgi:hypothetical protein
MFGACLLLSGHVEAGEQVYTLEAVNDPEFLTYPPPAPVSPREVAFDVGSSRHEETIDVPSRRLRNLSITLENRGDGLIRAPHLFGPHGWDFRSLEAIGEAVTDSPGLTREEKFIRVHEWKGLHVVHVTGTSYLPYVDRDFSSNPLRILNQYGHAMCGQSTLLVNALLRAVPPLGSMYGRSVKLGTHRVGEAYWGGAWHAYDTTPGTGVVQWIYYDRDNQRIAPSWKYLIEEPDLVTRVIPYTNATSLPKYLQGATGETFAENRDSSSWDFDFDLRPRESLTMHFDMRGRLDQRSMNQGNLGAYRGYSDYASAVFRYRPDLSSAIDGAYFIDRSNVRTSAGGLVPVDPRKPSWVVLEMRSVWCFAGATIAASFRTGGRVHVAVKPDPHDTGYSSDLEWERLSAGRLEYDASIEGKMAFWVKLEFEGAGSGLSAADISAEVQMSRWSMPGLRHGRNNILFEAEDMGGSNLRVTYRYDDRSPFHLYEPATSDRGRHVPIRIGGLLDKGAHLTRLDHGKARFWDRLHTMPGGEARTLIEIIDVSGDRSGRTVRTLVDRSLPWGEYELYWDGKDDAGRSLPRGMYAYVLSIDGKLIHGSRLYLYDTIWPVPNEIASGQEAPPPTQPREPEVSTDGARVTSAHFMWLEPLRRGGLAGAVLHPPRQWQLPGGTGGGAGGGGGRADAAPAIEGEPAREGGFSSPGIGLEPAAALDASRALPLLVKKLAGTASHGVPRKPGARRDHFRLQGVLPGLPPGWEPDGLDVLVSAGGAEAHLTLDRRGRGADGSAVLRIGLPRSRGVFPGGDVPFSLRLAGDLAREWLDEGVNPWEDEAGTLIPFETRIEIGGGSFEAVVDARLDSTAGGEARFVYPAGS